MAIKREVIARWTPSLSPDVLVQKLRWYVNGKITKTVILRERENRRAWNRDNPHYTIREGDTIQCMVCAVDEVGESDWVQAEVLYAYEKPAPPTNLTLEKVPVYLQVS